MQTTWSTVASGTTNDLYAVWADDSAVFVVGAGGTILRASDGTHFSAEPSGTTAALYGVSGAGGVVFAVGGNGTILRRDASGWTLERSGGPDLRAVFAVAAGEAWAVGDATTVLHRR